MYCASRAGSNVIESLNVEPQDQGILRRRGVNPIGKSSDKSSAADTEQA